MFEPYRVLDNIQTDMHDFPNNVPRMYFSSENQNQNSLLVKRQTDNTTPGGWGLTGGD